MPSMTGVNGEHDDPPVSSSASRTGSSAPRLWRSLEELADTDEFRRFVQAEFPDQASALLNPISRRDLLRIMGASLALAGISACARAPAEKIVPYVRAPEEFVPGHPLFFATAMTLGGFAKGVLVESHLGRPTKVEGNPGHPASLGATDTFAQASVLTLYDPDRSQTVTHTGAITGWPAFVSALNEALEAQRIKNGSGLRILTERVTSPTLADQLRSILQQFPGAKWHQYDPITRDNARSGARIAFGRTVQATPAFDRADVIVSLESDFLGAGPGNLRDTRQFSERRKAAPGRPSHESSLRRRGDAVDHRHRGRPSVPASQPGDRGRGVRTRTAPHGIAGRALPRRIRGATLDRFLDALARDLMQHRGASVVLAGDAQPATVHALTHLMNVALGNDGRTVQYIEPVEAASAEDMQSLRDLSADMDRGLVDLLIIVGGNPVYTAPRDLLFAEHVSRVKLRVHFGLYEDETSTLCHWHIPETHYLESWGDARAVDGTTTILQPLIAPLYGGKSMYELLAAVGGKPELSGYDIVRAYWQRQFPPAAFEERWEQALNDGVVAGTAAAPTPVRLQASIDSLPHKTPSEHGLEIVFYPDPTVWDGCFANNAWLQELPKPLTKLTWDNAALVSPTTASRLGVAERRCRRTALRRGAMVRAPVWIHAGSSR